MLELPSAAADARLPAGCLRDINKTMRERRRVRFGAPLNGKWRIKTEMVRPIRETGVFDPKQGSAWKIDGQESTGFKSFEEFLNENGEVDWEATDNRLRHPCIKLANGHGQLWEIYNPTQELHNFRIHQMKFRFARDDELRAFGVDPAAVKASFLNVQLATMEMAEQPGIDTWHDTIPVPAIEGRVFLVMHFDAAAQRGRFVYHCHILEHEDAGLMTPVEVIP